MVEDMSLPHVLRSIPLFSSLPRFELARLLPDLRLLNTKKGGVIERNPETPLVYFISSGQLQIQAEVAGDERVTVMTLGPLSVFGDLEPWAGRNGDEIALAMTDLTAVGISPEKLEEVFSRQPQFASHFTQMVAGRLDAAQSELVRARRILTAMTQELWDASLGLDALENVAAASTTLPEAIAMTKNPVFDWDAVRTGLNNNRAWLLANLVGGLIWIPLSYMKMDLSTRISLMIMVVAAVAWVFTQVPEFTVAVGALLVFMLLGLVPAKEVLVGYADPTWFMILGVFGLGAAISRSGLLYRTALNVLKLLSPTYAGQTMAMVITGLLVTPCLPSANARVALAGPLAMEVSDGLGFSRKSNGAAGIGMSCLLGFGHAYFLFLNGTSSCLLVWGLLSPEVREHVTWSFWFLAALPLGAFVLACSYLAIVRLLPVSDHRDLISRVTLRAQLDLLGPMSRMEGFTAVVVLSVLVGFITEPYHGLHPAWSSMLGFLALVCGGAVDRDTVKRGIDWNFLLLFGALISLAGVTRSTGVNDAIRDLLMPVLSPLTGNPTLFLIVVGLVTVVLRLAIPWQPVVMLVLVTLTPLAEATGYSPFLIGLVTLALSSPYFVPQQNTVYMTVHSGMEAAFEHKQVRFLAFVHTVIPLLGIALSVPFWRMLGLVP